MTLALLDLAIHKSLITPGSYAVLDVAFPCISWKALPGVECEAHEIPGQSLIGVHKYGMFSCTEADGQFSACYTRDAILSSPAVRIITFQMVSVALSIAKVFFD